MQPWLAPFNTPLCTSLLRAAQQGDDCLPMLNAAARSLGLHNARGLPLRFVPHAELANGVAYEQFIYDTGCVPTRAAVRSSGALHDVCNALMWLHYPHSKAVLNALQASAIAAHGVQATRGSLRDALTVFDESALVLCCPANDPAPQQLAQRHWHTLLHTRRNDWHAQLRPYLLGHAVLQKLQAPYPAITAQVWVLSGVDGSSMAQLDASLATSLSAAHAASQLSTQALLPLPVLGVPHWWAANADAAFYDNAQVFRVSPTQGLV